MYLNKTGLHKKSPDARWAFPKIRHLQGQFFLSATTEPEVPRDWVHAELGRELAANAGLLAGDRDLQADALSIS